MGTDAAWLTSGFLRGAGVAMVVLTLGACSSTSFKKTGDAAAVPEVERADLAARDGIADWGEPEMAGPDAGGPDLAGPDLKGPDPARAEVPLLDISPAGKDATDLSDLLAGKDAARSDLPASYDAILEDLPATVADALAGDVSEPDVPATDAALRDGPTVDAWNCKASGVGPVPCNDNPYSEALMGTCQADGTCVCASSFVLNPSTGRCMFPPRDASVRSDSLAGAGCTGDYNACGCGCCAAAPRDLGCYYPSLGETIVAITAQDQAVKNGSTCNAAGCASGVRYVCCAEPAPESPSSATYTGAAYSGGLDHVTISKLGDDCATVSFARPLTGSNAALKITMPSSWGVQSAGFGACGDAGVTDQAKGAVGTFALRASGSQCVADLHASLFAFAADGTVKSTRLDTDSLAVTGLPAGLCR